MTIDNIDTADSVSWEFEFDKKAKEILKKHNISDTFSLRYAMRLGYNMAIQEVNKIIIERMM